MPQHKNITWQNLVCTALMGVPPKVHLVNTTILKKENKIKAGTALLNKVNLRYV